jgi:uncharacterized protein with PIN domain
MDGRIEAGFRHRFRALLALVGPKRLEHGVDLLLRRGRERAAREGVPLGRALTTLYEETRTRVKKRLEVTGACSGVPPWQAVGRIGAPRFLCDPSLGGLARWLHAAGYEAFEAPDVPGYRLPDEAHRRGLVLLTTDAEALERRLVTSGELVVCWIPSALTMRVQLALVMGDLGLSLREPRCMACGGVLAPREKEAVRPRIPPRTALWKDEYYVCEGCDRLFWRGTHWDRIATTLTTAAEGA